MPAHDTIIIGAGPIGIEVAAELTKRGHDFALLEAGVVGSTMQWWAPGTRFFSSPERIAIAGVPLTTRDQDKATREEYLAYLRTVIGAFDIKVHTNTRVTTAKKTDDGFELIAIRSTHGVGGPGELERADKPSDDTQTETWRAKRLVLAIGNMHRPRLVGVPGEDLPHVSHYLADPHQYFPSHVLIVGGKNSAVEAAIRCHRVGCSVTMSYRRPAFDPDRIKYWLLPEIEWLTKKGHVTLHANTVPETIHARGAILKPASGGGHPIEVEADHIVLLTGYVQDPDLYEQLGVELVGEGHKPKFSLDTMETNVPGVFVAGTGSAGSQVRAKVFIETSHVHAHRIVAALKGQRYEGVSPVFELEEN